MFKTTKTHQTASNSNTSEAIERVTAQQAVAIAALDTARAAYTQTLAEVVTEDGAATLSLVSKARAKVVAAEADVAAAADALKTVQARQQASQRAAQRDSVASQWDKAHKAAQKRVACAKGVADRIASLSDAYREYLQSTEELEHALPAVPDPDGALLRNMQITGLVKQELVRRGLPAGLPSRPLHELPALADMFASLPDLVLLWKAQALEVDHD